MKSCPEMSGLCLRQRLVFGQAIIKAFRKAVTLAVQLVRDAAVSIEGKDAEDKKALLRKCASTTLNSKLARPSLIPRGAIFLCKALYVFLHHLLTHYLLVEEYRALMH